MDYEKVRKSVLSQELDTCGSKFGKNLRGLVERGILMEVEQVKAHRTKKEKENMSQFEKFVAEGGWKADDLVKAGAMLDEAFMAEARANTMQQERDEVYVAFQIFGQLPLPGTGMEIL